MSDASTTKSNRRRARGVPEGFFQRLADQSPHPTMWCDRSLVIRYVNTTGRALMKRLEAHLPVKASALVGTSIDVFHRHPEHQRAMLTDPSRLPHRARVRLGGEVFDLLAYALYDDDGEFLGPALAWDIATERAAAEARERENVRLAKDMKAIVDASRNPTMTIDLDCVITYVNPGGVALMKQLQQWLPVPAEKLVGQNIDIFHKRPAHQRALLSDPKNLPHEARVRLGPEWMLLKLDALFDDEGRHRGASLVWSHITDQVRLEEEQVRVRAQLDASAQALQQAAGQLVVQGQALRTVSSEVTQDMTSATHTTQAMAGRVSSVAAATEQLSATVRDIERTASETARLANAASDGSQTARAALDALTERVRAISSVSQLIGKVAQQTNLLALNATIEAARAGEVGRGFAVVANEVKALAVETGKSVDAIARQIEDVTTEVARSSQAMGGVHDVMASLRSCASSIAAAITEQSATVTDIAKNAAEVSASMGELGEHVSRSRTASESGQTECAKVLEGAESLNGLARALLDELASNRKASIGAPSHGRPSS